LYPPFDPTKEKKKEIERGMKTERTCNKDAAPKEKKERKKPNTPR
jgi:hypothetical protein